MTALEKPVPATSGDEVQYLANLYINLYRAHNMLRTSRSLRDTTMKYLGQEIAGVRKRLLQLTDNTFDPMIQCIGHIYKSAMEAIEARDWLWEQRGQLESEIRRLKGDKDPGPEHKKRLNARMALVKSINEEIELINGLGHDTLRVTVRLGNRN
ncbi:hypothetical protein [Deinococcus roseus]|uniref:Uncharacterized protein n=1 Tax=Deinococcus roseus TaxID=392414 RepID=A0ABQ2D7F1_9DEIO|nr:hypothetical protein [Deinococcus roseus]GGJ48046.1 hypothetical protein GCM10008938_37570 [Deinococcus roseus]